MYLCNLCGKLYPDENVSKKIVLVSGQEGIHSVKEKDLEVCLNCYGLTNMNYKLDEKARFVIPPNDKIKVYKISSGRFGAVDDNEDKDDNKKLVTNILKEIKFCEKKNCKKNANKVNSK